MDLFEEIVTNEMDQNPIIHMNEKLDHPNVEYEKLLIKESFNQQISSLAQYFLAPLILIDSNGIYDVPVFDNNIQEIFINEIAPHFKRVTKITTEKGVSLRVQNVREGSRKQFLNLFENRRVNAIVNDIYSKGTSSWEEKFTAIEYKVNLEAVNKSIEHDIVSMWNFFERSFVRAYGDLVILPNGWAFDESFKDKIAVQAFAGVCKTMMVTVNQENKMITSVFMN